MNIIMTHQKRIAVSMVLVAMTLTAKLLIAFKTNSLALLSDSWHLFTDLTSLTAPVEVAESSLSQEELLHKIQHLLTDQFGIAHSTIQIEHSACGSCFHRAHGNSQCTMCIDSAQKNAVKDLYYI